LAVDRELEAVGVDQRYRGISRDQHARVIEVTDNASGVMDFSHGPRNVECGVNEKAIIGLRIMELAGLWTIEFVHRLKASHQPHHEASEAAFKVSDDLSREGHKVALCHQGTVDHSPDLGLAASA
jgi:hypothetical protein